MKAIKVKRRAASLLKKGLPLISQGDLLKESDFQEGALVQLVDENNQFLANALLGKQHKGLGWVYSFVKGQAFDAAFLEGLFRQAQAYRAGLNLADQTTAYRFFNGESDGLGGLTIDIYGNVAVFSWYSQGIYQYAPLILEAFLAATPFQTVYEKCRFDQAEHLSAHLIGPRLDRVEIQENGVSYATYMDDGLMTGIFLDQREVRHYLMQHCQNQSLLNTFSYTAAFSVAAALGGAAETVSVDVANRSLEKSQEHFKLNGLALEHHRFYVMDVFDYFKYAAKKALTFDWVVLDPPSFARTKKRTFSVTKNYGDLLKDALAVTKKGGHIVVSTNAANFSMPEVKKMIERSLQEVGRAYSIEKVFQQPADFTKRQDLIETQYLKVLILKVD